MVTLADLDNRCPIMDLPKVTCAHCLGMADPDVVRLTAVRSGTCCRNCGEPIEVGDSIWRYRTMRQGWFGECCD